jgi:lysine decarboxylase
LQRKLSLNSISIKINLRVNLFLFYKYIDFYFIFTIITLFELLSLDIIYLRRGIEMDQSKTPFLDALKKYIDDGISPFDVPGHHMGNAENDFKDYIGELTYTADVNAPRGLDNVNHPSGVISEAEALMADCYGADEAFFLINGTSSGILAMIMATVKAHEEIILARNVHKSVINALIIACAIPVFVMPSFDKNLEISNQPRIEDFERAIKRHPNAKAVFVINPT